MKNRCPTRPERSAFPRHAKRVLLPIVIAGCILLAASTAAHARRQPPGHPLVVAYFPEWGVFGHPQYLVKSVVESGAASILDQIDYAGAAVKGGHCSLSDPNADLNYSFTAGNSVDGSADEPGLSFHGNFHQLQELKRRYPRLKILISLEGRAASFAEDAQPQNRDAFVQSCIDLFLRGHFGDGIDEPGIFDGLDIDWEYPREADVANYMALLTEFRRQMNALAPGLKLTIAAGASPREESGVDMAAVGKLVDEMGVMTYDYTGPWDRRTGFVAPLYSKKKDPNRGSIDRSVHEYQAAGVPVSKLLIGLPFYGYAWSQVGADNHGLFQHGRSIRADQPYWRIQSLSQGSKVYRRRKSRAAWLFNGDTFYTYDDPVSIRAKAQYARRHHLGGLMIWELSGDTADAQLLKTASYALRKTHPAPFGKRSGPWPLRKRARRRLRKPVLPNRRARRRWSAELRKP